MATIQGAVFAGSQPRNGITCKLWSSGAFTTPPAENTALPTSDPLDTVVTGPENGYDGAYRFLAVADGDYYVSQEIDTSILYDNFHIVTSPAVVGENLASNYVNLQDAINDTPSGGTLVI